MNVSKAVGGLLIVGLVSCTHAVMEGTLPPNTITFEKAVHFQTPEGGDLTVEPGHYQVEVSGEESLWLLGEQTKGMVYLVQAANTTHDEKVKDRTSIAHLEGEDELHVLLLLEDGKGLEGIGSYSGVQTRRASLRKNLSSTQIRKSMQARRLAIKDWKTNLAGSTKQQKVIPQFLKPELAFYLKALSRHSPISSGVPQQYQLLEGKFNQSTAQFDPTWHIHTWDVGFMGGDIGYKPLETGPGYNARFYLRWERTFPQKPKTPSSPSVAIGPKGKGAIIVQEPVMEESETYKNFRLFINGKMVPVVQADPRLLGPSFKILPNGDIAVNVTYDTRPTASPWTVQLQVTTSKGRILTSPITKVEFKPVLSWFEIVLAPIFQHDRCVSCHSVGDHNAIVKYHKERIGAMAITVDSPEAKPHNPEFCNTCHGPFAGNEWFSPAFVQGLNWTKATSPKQICEKATGPFTNKNGQLGPPVNLRHHFHDDPRIHWAVSNGNVPLNQPRKPVPLLHQLDTFFTMVDRWTTWKTPCPKTLYVDGQ